MLTITVSSIAVESVACPTSASVWTIVVVAIMLTVVHVSSTFIHIFRRRNYTCHQQNTIYVYPYIHSPLQENPSLLSAKPLLHIHRNPPWVLSHTCWHVWVPSLHSFTSEWWQICGQILWYTFSYMLLTITSSSIHVNNKATVASACVWPNGVLTHLLTLVSSRCALIDIFMQQYCSQPRKLLNLILTITS